MSRGKVRSPFPSFHPAVLVATWFGAGLLPRAPGTWGSLVALPFIWYARATFGSFGLALALAVTFAAGCWASAVFVARTGERDPPRVVVDEVVGQGLTLVIAPADPFLYLLGFLLFRLFDIVKPWPIGWVERKAGTVLGIMLDDVLAAVYAGAALFAITASLA